MTRKSPESEYDLPPAVWVATEKLLPWAKNPRKNDHAVADVAASIKRLGFGAPLVARRQNGEVIAGHTRLKAAILLRLPMVPVRYLDLSEEEAHLLALADNRLGEKAQWDDNALIELLQGFEPAEQLIAGWTEEDLKALEKRAAVKPEIEEDEVPEPPTNPITRLGDVWRLGPHTLVCGDGRQLEEKGRFGQVVTDPPYGIKVVKSAMVGADFGVAKKGKYAAIEGDDKTPDVRWLLKLAGNVTIWGGNYFADQLPPTACWIVWDKRGETGIENTFADCELAWSNRGGTMRVYRQLWNGMIRSGERGKRVHPTQKPVGLMAYCLGVGEGEVVDPYAGSGSLLMAAVQLERVATLYEMSPNYCDVIIQRYEAISGQKATCSRLNPVLPRVVKPRASKAKPASKPAKKARAR